MFVLFLSAVPGLSFKTSSSSLLMQTLVRRGSAEDDDHSSFDRIIGDDIRLRGDLALCFHNALAWDFHVISKRAMHGKGVSSQLGYFFEHFGVSTGHASAVAIAWLIGVIALNILEVNNTTDADTEVAALQLAARTWSVSVPIYGAYCIVESAQSMTQYTPLNFTAESIFCLTFLGLWRALYWQWTRGLL